jgi:hypothetical protein
MNNSVSAGLLTERDISVSNKMRIGLLIGRRQSSIADGKTHAHVPGIVDQPENFYTRRSSQSSATPTHPITWLLLLLWLWLGSLARTRTPEMSDCYTYLMTEYGKL